MVQLLVLLAFVLIAQNEGFLLFDRENILLVPSVAFRLRSAGNSTAADWLLYNQGWYYEEDPLQAKIMEKSLESIIKKDLDLERVKMFTADGEKHETVCIDGLNRKICTTTNDEGQIKNTFQVRDDELRQFLQVNASTRKVVYQVSNARKTIRATGEIYPCDENGVTFISDIDDTIKVTGVTSTTETLINTFSGQFKAIEGMSEAYQDWQRRYNASFAYVTASPDQLYPFLRSFLDRESFPQGSAHMRHFTWLDINFISFFTSNALIQHKTETIALFLDNTRNRRFVLIGDIFQKDPEIYASIAATYPNRISHIFIRKYANDTSGQQRLEQVFANYPRQRWSTFEIGTDLPRTFTLD